MVGAGVGGSVVACVCIVVGARAGSNLSVQAEPRH